MRVGVREMAGKFGRHGWKVRMFSIIWKIIILLLVAALGFAGFKAVQENREKEAVLAQPEMKKKKEAPKPSGEERKEPESVKTPTPEPTSTQEPTKAPDYPPITNEAVGSVTSTSALAEYGMVHSPQRLMDGDMATAWVEGVSGNGEGEIVTFTLNGTYMVSGFTINGGYQKNSDLYGKNSRPSEIEISLSDGTVQNFAVADTEGKQEFTLSEPKAATNISIKIVSVYAGWKYPDTAITEMSFY